MKRQILLKNILKLSCLVKTGDDGLKAIKKYGYDSIAQIYKKHGDNIIKYIPRYGDDAITLISQPNGHKLFKLAELYGDNIITAGINNPDLLIRASKKYGAKVSKCLKLNDLDTVLKAAEKYGDDVFKYAAESKDVFKVLEVYGKDGLRLLKNSSAEELLRVNKSLQPYVKKYGMPLVKANKNYKVKTIEKALKTGEKFGAEFSLAVKNYGQDVIYYTGKYGEPAFRIINKKGLTVLPVLKNYGDDLFQYTTKYGDDIVDVLSKSGERGLKVIDRYGEKALPVIAKYGDEAVNCFVKNGTGTLPMIDNFGFPIVKYMDRSKKGWSSFYKILKDKKLVDRKSTPLKSSKPH